MGVVYEAEDLDLNRFVALKLLKPGLTEIPDARTRFLREARAAARLQHDHIVPVYDIGEQNGIIFLALPLLEGESLDVRLKRQRLLLATETARIGYEVAQALAAAHKQGIIHRDVKPGNIWLETPTDRVKLFDFGLARDVSTANDLTQTELGVVIGTPSYMAPEQVAGEPVGPATDIHALGVVLYECLTGVQPFRAATIAQTLHRIHHDAPLPPRQLCPDLPLDLETITLKCLHKDPHKRYPMMAALAEDLHRWLNGQPITARPASRTERFLKWVYWHPALATALIFLLVGVVGLAVFTLLLMTGYHREHLAREEATFARKLAERSQRETAEALDQAKHQRNEAHQKARTAATVVGFLTDLLRSSDPVALEGGLDFRPLPKPENLRLRQVLDRSRERLKTHFEDEPLIRAALLDVIGNTHRSLGLLDQAEPLLQEALQLRTNHLEENHEDIVTSLYHLGWLRQDQGQFSQAEGLYRQALKRQFAAGMEESLLSAAIRLNLAWTLGSRSEPTTRQQLQESSDLIQEAVRIRRKHLGQRHRDVALALAALSFLQMSRNDLVGANQSFQEMSAALDSPDASERTGRVVALYTLARLHRKAGRYDQAERLYQQVLENCRTAIGEDHPISILLLGDYAGLLRQKGDLEGGVRAIRRALELGRGSPIRWHPAGIEARLQLGDYEHRQGNLIEAAELFLEAAEIARRANRPDQIRAAEDRLNDLRQASGNPKSLTTDPKR